VRDSVFAQIDAFTPAVASAALGVTVTTIGDAVVETVAFAPPTPPPAPPQAPEGRRRRIPRIAIIAGAVGGGTLLLLASVLVICYVCRQRRRMAHADTPAKRQPTVTIAIDGMEMGGGAQPAPPAYPS